MENVWGPGALLRRVVLLRHTSPRLQALCPAMALAGIGSGIESYVIASQVPMEHQRPFPSIYY